MPKPNAEGVRSQSGIEQTSGPEASVVVRYIDVSIVGGSAEVQEQLKETCARMAELLGIAPATPDAEGGRHG